MDGLENLEDFAGLDAERCVLGGLMLDEAAPSRIPEVHGRMFYLPRHRLIFSALAALVDAGEPRDVVSVSAELEQRGLLGEAGGLEYLIELAQNTPSAANIARYAKIVIGLDTERRLRTAGMQICEIAQRQDGTAVEDKCAEAAALLGGVCNPGRERECGYAQAAGMVYDYLAEEGRPGIPTGLAALDDMTGGLQRGSLTVIAARPGMGKTVLAENIARHAAKQGLAVLFQSYEMSPRELAMRGMAAEAEIDFGRLKHRRLTREEDERRAWFGQVAQHWRLDIDCAASDAGRLCLNARNRALAGNLDLLVIDHLHLMPRPGKNSEVQELGDITARLKRLAVELDIPVLLLAQLNRAVARQNDKRPTMADIRGSGSIEQDANLIIMPHRPGYYDENESPFAAELIVAKNRDGETGTVHAGWDGRFQRFTESAPHRQPKTQARTL